MKKYVLIAIVAVLFILPFSPLSPPLLYAAPVTTALGDHPASGQVTCGATATLLYAATSTAPSGGNPYGRISITFQNQSSQPVYIAPRADITTSNAGVLLITQGHAFTFDRSSGNVAWYCITASSTATVGWTEEK